MSKIENTIKANVRDVHDFPKPGIVFKDISTLLINSQLCLSIVDELSERVKDMGVTKVAGIESRGFIFGHAIALKLGVPFVMIRKEGKLPYKKVKHAYDLEYGSAVIEVHYDAFVRHDKVLIHDDLLATGGTAVAACKLVKHFDASVAAFACLIDLSFLNGQEKLHPFTENIIKLATY